MKILKLETSLKSVLIPWKILGVFNLILFFAAFIHECLKKLLFSRKLGTVKEWKSETKICVVGKKGYGKVDSERLGYIDVKLLFSSLLFMTLNRKPKREKKFDVQKLMHQWSQTFFVVKQILFSLF
jgi:hypothetical protein